MKEDVVIFKEDLTNLFSTFKSKEGDFKNGVLSRLNKLEEYFSKNDRRLLTVERETSVQKNDLASHKLLKERQFENLEEKTWELRDFKEELQR